MTRLVPAAATLALALATALAADPAPHYTVGVLASPSATILHAAETRGLWRASGTRVHVVTFDRQDALDRAATLGQVDFFHGPAAHWESLRATRNVDVVHILQTDDLLTGDRVFTRASADLFDARASHVALARDDLARRHMLDAHLRRLGLALADFRPVHKPADAALADLLAGRIPAALLHGPAAHRAATNATLQAAPASDGLPETLAARADRLAAIPQPDAVQVVRGVVLALGWLASPTNRPAAQAILRGRVYQGAPPQDASLDPVRVLEPLELALRNSEGSGLTSYLASLRTLQTGDDPATAAAWANRTSRTSLAIEALSDILAPDPQ